MKWRPPKKMTTSAGPGLRPYNEDSKKFENIPDPRQPVSPPFRVTGIVGAWTTEVTLDVAEGAVAGTGYIFLVSNGDRYRYDEPKPANFFEDLENELMECFHVTIQMGDGKASDNNIHYPIMIPLSDEWGKTQNYRAVHLVPEKEINKVAWIVDLFELQGTDVQSAVVVMYPAKAKERITEKVRIAMETLEVEPKPPELRLPPPKEGVPGGPGVPLLPGAAPAKPSGF